GAGCCPRSARGARPWRPGESASSDRPHPGRWCATARRRRTGWTRRTEDCWPWPRSLYGRRRTLPSPSPFKMAAVLPVDNPGLCERVSRNYRSMRQPSVAEMNAFVSVAEQKSFAKAALQLGVSRSGLSETIGALEARLGVRLLNRTTRSVGLTPAGERLLARVRPVL